jgi:hypothetical protein
MTTYMLLYIGPPTGPDASHEGWPEWFQSLGDKLVDVGSPMTSGFVVRGDGVTSEAELSLNGYSLIRAEDPSEVHDLLRTHPLLADGSPYRVDVFGLPRK